jgi:CTD small phosphatase-like protein 2
MIEPKEEKQEKYNPKIFGIKNSKIRRDSVKKSTISLSEEPNIIFDKTQFYDIFKSNKNEKIEPKQPDLENFYPNKLKNSFINEPISPNKDESRSNLSEIQMIVKASSNPNTNNVSHTNKSIGKKEKKKTIHSKRKNSVETMMKNKKNKEMDKEGDELKINNDKTKKHHHSTKKKLINYLDDEPKEKEKGKVVKIKFRKSDIIRPFKKNSMMVGDDNKRNKKRKSLFSHNGHSPDKQYTNEIFEKFFNKKNSFEVKEDKRNLDKIFINIKNQEVSLITVNTKQETVKNYYDYMQDCFKIIDLYYNKTIKLQPREPVNFNFKENKKVVIFELESTLVSCFGETLSNEENDLSSLGINIRPHLKSSLDLIKNDYNIVIYSSNHQMYVDQILDYLDPDKEYFNYRLYQNHCYKFSINNKVYFTKDLNIFKGICDLKDIVIVDCSVLGFGFFLDNGIPIIPFYDSKEDVELKLLSYYLVCIASNNDLRLALKRDMKLDSYLEVAKKLNKAINNEEVNEEKEKGEIKKAKTIKGIKSFSNSNMGEKAKSKNKCSKTNVQNNLLHNMKGSSDSDEDKKSNNNKRKNKEKNKKHKKEQDKISPKKDSNKILKKKNRSRKNTGYEFYRNDIDIKSPKKTSPHKSHKESERKIKDKNKISSNQ